MPIYVYECEECKVSYDEFFHLDERPKTIKEYYAKVKGREGKQITMSPDEYLSLIVEDKVAGKITSVKESISKGDKQGMPWLQFDEKGKIVHLQDQQYYRKMRLIPEDQFNFTNEINIYDDKVSIISFKDELIGMIIESNEISSSQRAIFDMCWKF